MKKVMLLLCSLTTVGYADLGIMDTASESAAKNEAQSIGISTVYDHPADSSNGQFVVPVQYNRTNAEGNGTEHDANDAKKNDIDYIPLSQLKGATGTAGVAGSQGDTGAQGVQGNKGNNGAKGEAGRDGRNGDDGDNRLTLNLGASVRWYDWKNVNLTSGARYDVHHYGWQVDMMMVNIKIGKSYESRQQEKLEARLGLMERMLKGAR